MEKPDHKTVAGQNDRLTAAIFCCVTAIVLGVVYYVARIGFRDNPPTVVIQSLALSFFLLLFPSAYRQVCSELGRPSERTWLTSDAGLSLITLLSLPLLSLAGTRLGVSLLPAVAILGMILFAATLINWLAQGSIGKNLVFFLGAGLFGLWMSFAVWGNGYHNPLYEEALAGGYYLCKDILVTGSITSTLRTYGFPSTGLDGIPYCWYHWGAYWFFAWISEGEKVRVIRFIQLGYPVIFLPFLLYRFLEFAIHARELLSADSDARALRYDGIFWLLFLVGWIGFVPWEVSQRMMFGINLIFYSESYGVGSACSFLVLSLGIWLLRRGSTSSAGLTWSDHCLICLLPVLLAGIGFIKISQMYLLVIVFGYLFLRLRAWRIKTPVVALAAGLLLLPLLVKLTSPGGAGGAYSYIYPMAVFVSLVPLAWKPFFFLLYYFWSWAFIIGRLSWERVVTIADLKEAVVRRKLIPVEVIVVLCVLGSAPALMLPIGGGSGFFFMDFQSWFALSLLLADPARLREVANRLCGIRDAAASGWSNIRLRNVFALFVGLCLLGSAVANAQHWAWRMVYQNLSIRDALVHPETLDRPYAALEERLYKRAVKDLKARNLRALKQFASEELLPLVTTVQDSLEHARGYPVVAAFRELDALPAAEKRNTLVFIPRSNRAYWDLLPMCEAVPLVVPSLTGMAMIDGLPGPDCRTYLGHYDMYSSRVGRPEHPDQSRESLCAAARAKGFSGTIIVDSDKENRMTARQVACP